MDIADRALTRRFMTVVAMAGGFADAQGLLAFIDHNREVLDLGVAAVARAVQRGEMHLGDAFALLDCVKGLSARHLMFESQTGHSGSTADARIAVTHRSAVESYLNERPRPTAAVSFHLVSGEQLLMISAANYPMGGQPGDGRVEYRCAVINRIDDGLLESVAAFSRSVDRGAPDLALLSKPLAELGYAVGALLGGQPVHEVIFVPHKALHALPLHALVLHEASGLYLHDVVNSIRFCSSLFDALTSGTWVAPPGHPQTGPRLVSVMERDSPLPGVELYRKMLDALRLQLGGQIRIDDLHRLGDLPGGFQTGDTWVNWHGHGRSSPNAWGASYLTLGDDVVSGRTIATTWRLPGRPHVVLASCQSAVDGALTPVVDEYCGLDVAFRIAGARSVAASMWDLGDPVATFTAVRLTSSFLQAGKPPAHSLTALQRAFRNCSWKAALLRPEQLAALPAEQAELLREYQAPFERLPGDAFADPRRWATMRAHG
ncbi:CHAT domain-containing protein [Actinoplanes sp. NPDC026670]|uniref:CHAT domain-containing protein n=1 Tax=Actinoplanes sp. NPDC026670 TaxID=3154700 RepID=UPI0033F8AFFE